MNPQQSVNGILSQVSPEFKYAVVLIILLKQYNSSEISEEELLVNLFPDLKQEEITALFALISVLFGDQVRIDTDTLSKDLVITGIKTTSTPYPEAGFDGSLEY